MPTYQYRCPSGHEFEKFQKMTERPRAKCPTCGRAASRKISGGAGLVFKGSGFYITDYGKDGKGPRKATGDGAPPPTGDAAGAKAEVKPAATASSAPGDAAASAAKSSKPAKAPE